MNALQRLGWLPAALAGLSMVMAGCSTSHAAEDSGHIVLERQGAFATGGAVKGEPDKSTLSCDHGYVEYQIPVDARKTALFMWHSSSAAVWQTRWDGGEGYRSIMLKRGYPVYLWDGPRVGRANWGCEPNQYEPGEGRDQGNFLSWRFGDSWLDWYDGIQFPTEDANALDQAMRARYLEFDTTRNVRLQAHAGAEAADEIGPVVMLTNSAGGLRAMLAAMESDNIKAIVAYESAGFPFPEGLDPDAGGWEGPETAFGPIFVSDEEFERLTRIPLQFVWGDNIDSSPGWIATYEQCAAFVELINARGGQAEILMLPDAGLKGNTHIPFMDMNNGAVADLLSGFLAEHGLDAR